LTEVHRQQRHSDGNSFDRVLGTACERLGQHLDRRFDLAEFCRRQGWGYESFRKKFKAELGISPGQYRIRRRIDAAGEMLNRHDLSIREIAFRLGYRSPYEFSSQFKDCTGLSPLQFRNGGHRAAPAAEREDAGAKTQDWRRSK
ncbi:MAG: AraC family transcriptional regulator, partial [Victivallales bacterium]|nr:AraC family transcriptional regulator [Victivallales bacterium]